MEQEEYKTLCWKCENACNIHKCKWVKFCYVFGNLNFFNNLTKDEILKHMPDGTELDEKENIISCPNFVHDKLLYGTEERAKSHNLSVRKYNTRRSKIKKIIVDMFEINAIDFDKYFDQNILEYYFNIIFSKHNEIFKSIVTDYLNGEMHLTTKYNKGRFEIKRIIFDFLNELKELILNDYDNHELEDHDKLIEDWHKRNRIKLKENKNNCLHIFDLRNKNIDILKQRKNTNKSN